MLDDLALPLGRLRLRAGGGPGGHNGLESIIVRFGTEEIPRLRIGIGASATRRISRLRIEPVFRRGEAGLLDRQSIAPWKR